jgi:hypothetical protein
VFAVTGIAYLFVPSLALALVGIESEGTTDFLLRTEGVALLTAAVFIAAIAMRPTSFTWLALAALGGYYVVGSLVDLLAFGDGVVGPASVPSAGVRIALGMLAVVAAWRVGGLPETP